MSREASLPRGVVVVKHVLQVDETVHITPVKLLLTSQAPSRLPNAYSRAGHLTYSQ